MSSSHDNEGDSGSDDRRDHTGATGISSHIGDDKGWTWLQSELAPGMCADDSEFIAVSAKDVISRNKRNFERTTPPD
jgi:hypothetical protein